METSERSGGRLLYIEYDRIPIPEDIPELGIERGNEGVIHTLDYADNRVHASVMVTYSTNRTRGWVDMQLLPEEKVSSYAFA